MIAALLRWLLAPAPPQRCTICGVGLGVAPRLHLRPGEMHVAGTCSEPCSIERLERALAQPAPIATTTTT